MNTNWTTLYYSDSIGVAKHWAPSIIFCNLITDSSFVLERIRVESDLRPASFILAVLLLAHSIYWEGGGSNYYFHTGTTGKLQGTSNRNGLIKPSLWRQHMQQAADNRRDMQHVSDCKATRWLYTNYQTSDSFFLFFICREVRGVANSSCAASGNLNISRTIQ